MTDIRLSDADARAIAGCHTDAAEGIEGVAGSAPQSVDAGSASALVGQVLAALAVAADDVAVANRQVANLVDSVADDFFATEEAVAEGIAGLRAALEER